MAQELQTQHNKSIWRTITVKIFSLRSRRVYKRNEKGLPIMTVPVPMPPVKPPRDQQAQSSSAQQPKQQPAQWNCETNIQVGFSEFILQLKQKAYYYF